MKKPITIGKTKLTSSGPLYFIADIGSNHDGQLKRAYRLIELAKQAGANAAKFQNFRAETLISPAGFARLGQRSNQAAWKQSVFDTYRQASLPLAWTPKLKAKCDRVGIDYLTSPYDFAAVEAVAPYVPAYKIGSGDLSWPAMLAHIAKQGKPVIIATGAAGQNEVDRAMATLQKHTPAVVLMQCNTNYTASPENFKHINLNVLKTFRQKYPRTILGLSDHTPGYATVLGAVALGATVFEKHFTDDNRREGQDHKFAMDSRAWREMVDRANELHQALGDGIKRVEPNERETVHSYKRGIYVQTDQPAGAVLRLADLIFLRPLLPGGLAPDQTARVIGKKLRQALKAGGPVLLNNLK